MAVWSPILAALTLLPLAPEQGNPAPVRLVDVEEMTVLSHGLDLAEDPTLAAWGETAIAAWKGVHDGRQQVFAAFWTPGGWSSPYSLVPEPGREGTEPFATFSAQGSPALAWVSVGAEEQTLHLRTGLGEPLEIASSAARIETPVVAFDAMGNPFVAWSEGGAARFELRVWWSDPDHGPRTEIVSDSPHPYDLFPSLFGGSAPRLYWYALGREDFELRAREFGPRGWEVADTTAMGWLPSNRLPLLFDRPGATLPGAVWVEPRREGELLRYVDPLEGDLTLLARPIARTPGGRQLDPDVAESRTHDPVFAWREETPLRTELRVRHDGVITAIIGMDHPSQPRLAIDARGGLHLAAVSDQIEGGTGQLYWIRLGGEEEPQAGELEFGSRTGLRLQEAAARIVD